MIIKLKSKGYWDEYFCKITDRLDQLAGLKITNDGYCWRHYIVYDDYDKKNNIMAIRIPGGTVGGIKLDDNNVIKEIKVNTNYVVSTYPDNVEEIMNDKFVGFKVEVENEHIQTNKEREKNSSGINWYRTNTKAGD